MKSIFKARFARVTGKLSRALGAAAIAAVIVFSMTAATCGGAGGGGGGKGAGLTITGIPSEYNGKYAYITWTIIQPIAGAIDPNASPVLCPRISNGSVTIPLWTINLLAQKYTRYSGDDTAGPIPVGIGKTDNLDKNNDGSGNVLAVTLFGQVEFVKGSATVAWDSGALIYNP